MIGGECVLTIKERLTFVNERCAGLVESIKIKKENAMDYRKMTAPCGIDCFNCAMVAAKENDQLRSIIAKNMNLPYEEAVCSGCRNQNGICSAHSLTEPCSVYKCIEKKGLEFCFECEDFPCDFLHPYADQAGMRPHNTKVFNLCLMKKMGVEAWGETKARKVRDTYFKEKFKL